uniref:hypothetical protein n=1 Tax=Parasutterella excrementihominis TaxID=487175 RepID=UPI003FEF907E
MLSKITHQNITSYLKLRNQRCVEHFNKVKTQAEELKKPGPRFRYLALDSTALSTYSVTISNAHTDTPNKILSCGKLTSL